MVGRGWMSGASIEETLELWAASLREVKARMRPLLTQERVAASAGLFLDGLLGRSGARRAGCGPKRRVTPAPGGSRRSPLDNLGAWPLGCRCVARHRARLCARTPGGG